MRIANRVAVAALILFICVQSVLAQNRNRRYAATDLAAVDADFGYVGEFLGRVAANCDQPNGPVIGMQVVALGDGQFTGMAYDGGLPGNGWNRSERFALQGRLEGDRLVMNSDRLTFSIRDVHASVQGADGQPLGTLRKVIRTSPTLGKRPPRCATVLFDGRDASAFKNAKIKGGLLQIGTELLSRHRHYTMHVEFLLPYMPYQRSQGRANSGVYLQSRYEVQILDSFGLNGQKNECGALYRYRAPDLNMAFPPLNWQTYDITFRAPIFDRGRNKVCNARLTVLHNGVRVHSDVSLERKTGAGRKEGPNLLPTKLQDHGNPVQFRNIWILDHDRRYTRR